MNVVYVAGITALAYGVFVMLRDCRISRKTFLQRPNLSKDELLTLFATNQTSVSPESLLELLGFLGRECGVPAEKLRPTDRLRTVFGPPKLVDDELHSFWDLTANRPRLRDVPLKDLEHRLQALITVEDYCRVIAEMEG